MKIIWRFAESVKDNFYYIMTSRLSLLQFIYNTLYFDLQSEQNLNVDDAAWLMHPESCSISHMAHAIIIDCMGWKVDGHFLPNNPVVAT